MKGIYYLIVAFVFFWLGIFSLWYMIGQPNYGRGDIYLSPSGTRSDKVSLFTLLGAQNVNIHLEFKGWCDVHSSDEICKVQSGAITGSFIDNGKLILDLPDQKFF